jgi:hypothetical protein
LILAWSFAGGGKCGGAISFHSLAAVQQPRKQPGKEATNVRFWHKADIPRLAPMSAFGGKADIDWTCSDVRF